MDQEYRREPCSIRLDNSASFRPAACGVVIGATKCGTTSFYRALASHPFVCPSRMKELNVFLEEETSPAGPDAYLEHFSPNPLIHRVTLEASPQYTHAPRFEGVADRMAQSGIPFRLIYIVRDPFDRLESHYKNGLGEGFLTAGPSEWLDEYGVMASDYAMQLKPFKAVFPASDILVLSFDMLVAAPRLAHALACRHLGIPDRLHLHQRHENRGEAFIFERAKRLSGQAEETAYPPDADAISAVRSEVRLTGALRKELRSRWADGMTSLSSTYGIDVSRWGFSGASGQQSSDLEEALPWPHSETELNVPGILEADCPEDWRPELEKSALPGLKQSWFQARTHWASGELLRGKVYGRRAERLPDPKYSIVIASYERPAQLEGLLKSLRALREETPAIEVFVVIDGDQDPAYDALARRFCDLAVFLRLRKNQGPGVARNAGAAISSGDFLVFLDDDCRPEGDHLVRLTERLRTYPNIVAAGGPTIGLNDKKRDLFETYSIMTGLNPKPGYHNGRLICLPSCNLAVRRDWFLSVNGFDPALRASEDFNLTFRLKAAGALLYDDPEWQIRHDQNWKLSGILNRAKRDGYWLSAHANRAQDELARDILPRAGLDTLQKDISDAMNWRWKSWKHMPVSRRYRYAGIEALRQVWRWRGVRKFYSERGKSGPEPKFQPEQF